MVVTVVCFVVLGCFSSLWLQAQADTSLLLQEAVVMAPRARAVALGERSEHWDSLQLARYSAANLADLLSREGGVFIKSYGLGSLATSSVRGGSAGHTLVHWNGLPITSPSLGLLDVSLLPVAFTDELSLTYGGQSALWGSGAIGGLIGLNNRAMYGQGWGLKTQFQGGSFGERDIQARLSYSNDRLALQSRFFYREANNDFPYEPSPGLGIRRQAHAAIRQLGLMQSAYWRLSPRQELAAHLWMQQSERQIPPTLVQNRSEAQQADSLLRLALHWQRRANKWLQQTRTGFFQERIRYEDPSLRLSSPSAFTTFVAETETEYRPQDNSLWQCGLNYTYTTAQTTGYRDAPPIQHQWAVFAAWRQHWTPRWHTRLAARQEWVNGQLLPLMPSLGLSLKLADTWEARAQLSRNYRFPTFNDRYWSPGGNPNLLPEQGWSQEAGLHTRQGRWLLSATAYHRYLQHWVLWYPAPGQSYWQAGNVAAVRSRGLELRFKGQGSWAQWHWRLDGGYDYTRSTNEVSLSLPLIKAGEQLVYVPLHQAYVGVYLSRRNWSWAYQHRYTGGITTLSEPLPAYQLGFGRMGYALQKAAWGGSLFLQVNNLWNAHYQAVERRPMPGRQYQLGLQLNLHRPRP